MIQTLIHYSLHFLAPGVIARFFYRKKWLKVWGILLLTMFIDIDHLWANPIFDPDRCSVGFHTFHSLGFIILYILFLFFKKTRIIGIGLTLHIFTDFIDCLFIKYS